MQGTATHLGASEMPSLKGAKRPNVWRFKRACDTSMCDLKGPV
jgi:hypothetical protein